MLRSWSDPVQTTWRWERPVQAEMAPKLPHVFKAAVLDPACQQCRQFTRSLERRHVAAILHDGEARHAAGAAPCARSRRSCAGGPAGRPRPATGRRCARGRHSRRGAPAPPGAPAPRGRAFAACRAGGAISTGSFSRSGCSPGERPDVARGGRPPGPWPAWRSLRLLLRIAARRGGDEGHAAHPLGRHQGEHARHEAAHREADQHEALGRGRRARAAPCLRAWNPRRRCRSGAGPAPRDPGPCRSTDPGRT